MGAFLALRPKHKRFEGFGRRLLGVSLGRGGDDNNENDKNIMFSQNDIPVKNTSHAEELQLCTV